MPGARPTSPVASSPQTVTPTPPPRGLLPRNRSLEQGGRACGRLLVQDWRPSLFITGGLPTSPAVSSVPPAPPELLTPSSYTHSSFGTALSKRAADHPSSRHCRRSRSCSVSPSYQIDRGAHLRLTPPLSFSFYTLAAAANALYVLPEMSPPYAWGTPRGEDGTGCRQRSLRW